LGNLRDQELELGDAQNGILLHVPETIVVVAVQDKRLSQGEKHGQGPVIGGTLLGTESDDYRGHAVLVVLSPETQVQKSEDHVLDFVWEAVED
jgi:hypothetical protein